MKPEFAALAKYRLEKARKTLGDAKLFYGEATSVTVVNRIYYAMFYAVIAVLITEGKYSSKHSGIRSVFNRDFVKPGIVSIDDGKFFSEMYDSRQEGDYSDYGEFTAEEVALWLENAEGFIDRIAVIITSRIESNV